MLSSKEHWEKEIVGVKLPKKLGWAQLMVAKTIQKHLNRKGRCLEVGASASAWLPFFNKSGYIVYGLDYVPSGCFLARENLKVNGGGGLFVCGDVLSLPFKNESFDVIFSYGLVEHFENARELIKKINLFLKKDGLLITVIPNLNSKFYWYMQKILDCPILEQHKIYSQEHLIDYYKDLKNAGVYFSGVFNISMINFDIRNKIVKVCVKLLFGLTNRAMRLFLLNKETSFFSPYIVAVGRKV